MAKVFKAPKGKRQEESHFSSSDMLQQMPGKSFATWQGDIVAVGMLERNSMRSNAQVLAKKLAVSLGQTLY